jgi:hypothetical protein
VDAVSQASVEGSVFYVARPLPDFNKYEALEMLDSLQTTAKDRAHDKKEYYKLAYHTARDKLDLPKEQFQLLIRRLLGDKDHDKILDIVAKVEKTFQKTQTRSPALPYGQRGRSSRSAPRCFFCHKPGHFKADCYEFRQMTQAREARSSPGDRSDTSKG